MQRRMVVTLAILALLAGGVTACKKKGEEATTTPGATATAPGSTTTTPGSTAATPGSTATTGAASATTTTGEQLFKQHCEACHPNGGNTIKPDKPLSKSSLAKHKITTSDDIVKVMRSPGPGMNRFDTTMIPDSEAKKIGDYILATFP